MSTRDKIASYIDDGPALFFEPAMFDEAILGIAERPGQDPLVAYDRTACIEIIMANSRCTREEAEEYFEFNTACAWMGEGTPIIVDGRYAE